MTTSTPATDRSDLDAREAASQYLIVDEFLRNLVGTRALKSALDLGLIDALDEAPRELGEVAAVIDGDAAGARLLIDLLAAEAIVEIEGSTVALSERFRQALAYRDLLDTRLDFVGFVLLDFIDRFNDLVTDQAKFMAGAQLFRLFDYRRSTSPSPDNYAWTKVWMRLTTALTRHEAGACLARYDFGRHRRMLDVGGNSGEFALRACKAHPELRAVVMDLPVVCEFGQDHVLAEPERERISFVAGSALSDPLPESCDLITFKSMLHDWPDDDALRLLDRAAAALKPGGTLLVFERGPLDFAAGAPPVSLLPILLFARSYRGPTLYEGKLEDHGFEEIHVQHFSLDSPFFLLTARKPEA